MPKGQGAEYKFGDVTVVCTNVDRVVFPAVGITKGDLIAYYRDVADVMVPELRDRPLTLERYTKGLAGGGFFQKHAQKHFPPWIEQVELGVKTRVRYPICDDAAGLVYFANQGAIALHVWTSRRQAPDHPDEIVFDLDPPEGRFDLVRRAARVLFELLGEIGLTTFVKTSGSKGLHVIVPLDGKATYPEAQALCTRVCTRMCSDHPDEFTVEFYKKDRKGRLFLDTMRNSLGATVVAPYSVRGRANAPVSTPIGWDEVEDPKLAPDGICVPDIRDRLDAWGDHWSELREQPGSVAKAMKLFDRH